MTKKILSFLLLLTMIMSFGNFTGSNYVSAAKNNYEVIKALGLTKSFPAEHSNVSDKPTRAELAAIAANIIHPSMLYSIDKVYFEDVKNDYWALKQIELVASIGIMRGFQGYFRPDDEVSFIESIVTFVRICGYENVAENRGGYPSGYLLVAADKGILRGVSSGNDEKITFDILSKLILNALDVNMMLMTSVGADTTYTSTVGKTVLTECLKYVKVKGIVTENSLTSLVGSSNLLENQVIINGNKYYTGTTNAASYLGYNLLGYAKYDEETEKSTLLYIEPTDTKEFIINAEDIEMTTKTSISYTVRDDVKEVKIPERIFVIYNNVYIDRWDENTLKPESGKLKLVDNDFDSKYDIIFIETYNSYIVDTVNVNNFTIHDKYGLPPLVLDTRNHNLEAVIKFGNENIKISDLQEWDVLTVISSKNETGKRIVEAYLTRDSFSGTIAEVDEDGIVVGEQYFRLGASLKSMVEAGQIQLRAGNIGKFYLDKYSDLVAYLDNQTGGPGNTNQYGYLYRATKNKGLGTGARFQVITSEGKMVIFEGAKKIKFSDGITEKVMASEDYLTAPSFTTDQVIMYNLNEAGEIKSINFPVYGKDESKFSIDGIFNERTEKSPQNVLVTRATAGSFSVSDVYYNMDPSRTLILAIPKVSAGQEINESQIEIIHPDRLPQYEGKDDSGRHTDESYYDGGLAVDLDETDTAGMILIKKPDWAGASQWTQQTNQFIVSRVKSTIDEEGEIVPTVMGYFDGYELTLAKAKDIDIALDLNSLRAGDILQVMLSTDRSKITNARRVFTLSDRPTDGTAESHCIYYNTAGVKELYQTDRGPMYSECFIGLVDVVGYSEKNLKVSFDYNNTTITYPYRLYDHTKITVIDTQGGTFKVYAGTEQDIGVGTRVYINSRDTQLRDLVVLRN